MHVECSFSTRVRGGKAVAIRVRGTSCLLCSETRLKTFGEISIRSIARSLKAYSPVVYEAVMDRITRWVPELRDYFERAAAKVNVKHKRAAAKGKVRLCMGGSRFAWLGSLRGIAQKRSVASLC